MDFDLANCCCNQRRRLLGVASVRELIVSPRKERVRS
jgi:hypothetical protein